MSIIHTSATVFSRQAKGLVLSGASGVLAVIGGRPELLAGSQHRQQLAPGVLGGDAQTAGFNQLAKLNHAKAIGGAGQISGGARLAGAGLGNGDQRAASGNWCSKDVIHSGDSGGMDGMSKPGKQCNKNQQKCQITNCYNPALDPAPGG